MTRLNNLKRISIMKSVVLRIKKGGICGIFFILLIFLFTLSAFAFHPLITDDAGTQGKGRFKLEFGFEYDYDNPSYVYTSPKYVWENFILLPLQFTFPVREHYINNSTQMSATLSYGIIDKLDFIIGIPYQYNRSKETKWLLFADPAQPQPLPWKSTSAANGLADIMVQFKWNFFDYKALHLAVKPGVIFPSGNADNGLGAGKLGGFVYIISTVDLNPVLLHLNLGYIRNQNRVDQRDDLWHSSLALECWLVKDYLRLVANTGFERNRFSGSNIQDLFILGGLVCSPTPNFDIDLGFKHTLAPRGMETPGPDYTFLGGITIRFGDGSNGITRKNDPNGPGK